MEMEHNITDFIPLIGTDRKVSVNIGVELWVNAFVVGIDIIENRLKLEIVNEDGGRNRGIWIDLFFQLNHNHPKIFKVKII